MLQKRLIHFFNYTSGTFQPGGCYFRSATDKRCFLVLVISLLIIGFVAEARRLGRYNLYQKLLREGDDNQLVY